MKHEITYEDIGEEEQTVGRYPNREKRVLPRWAIICTCGWKDRNNDYGYQSNADGSISKHVRTIGWNHIVSATDPSGSRGAPMELVGQIIKKRVTNEIWIVSANGEYPDDLENSWIFRNRTHRQHIYPWAVLRKHPRGWKAAEGPFQLKEYAYAQAIDILHDGYIDGFDVDIAAEVNMDTVEIPFGTIDTYFKRLIEKANEATKPEDLINLREKITKAQAVCDLLDEAQNQITGKLLGI